MEYTEEGGRQMGKVFGQCRHYPAANLGKVPFAFFQKRSAKIKTRLALTVGWSVGGRGIRDGEVTFEKELSSSYHFKDMAQEVT